MSALQEVTRRTSLQHESATGGCICAGGIQDAVNCAAHASIPNPEQQRVCFNTKHAVCMHEHLLCYAMTNPRCQLPA
jgi:hypothetical protein